MAKLYEIANFLDKKVRRKGWKDPAEYIYYRNGNFYCEDGIFYTGISAWQMFVTDDWEEYVEPKPKKKYTMYRHWYLDLTGILCQCCTDRSWEDFSYTCNGGTLLETEVVKEFEVSDETLRD